MAVIQDIPQVLDREVISITKSLTGMELTKADEKLWDEECTMADVIHITGNYRACIICEARQEMFHHIISAMYGGSLPPEEERTLYINEYMNIICGQIVSKLNNLTGKSMRLSVPEYCVDGTYDISSEEWLKCAVLAYHAEQGNIRFIIHYTVQ